jgi:hypothetical protein
LRVLKLSHGSHVELGRGAAPDTVTVADSTVLGTPGPAASQNVEHLDDLVRDGVLRVGGERLRLLLLGPVRPDLPVHILNGLLQRNFFMTGQAPGPAK